MSVLNPDNKPTSLRVDADGRLLVSGGAGGTGNGFDPEYITVTSTNPAPGIAPDITTVEYTGDNVSAVAPNSVLNFNAAVVSFGSTDSVINVNDADSVAKGASAGVVITSVDDVVSFDGARLTAVADPTDAQDAVTLAYFQNPANQSSLVITDTYTVADEAAMLALGAEAIPAEKGDVAVRTDVSKTFILAGTDPSVLADWVELKSPTAPVSSFNSRTGAVTLTSGDVTGALTFTPANKAGDTFTGLVSFNNNGYIRTDAANTMRFQCGTSGYEFRNSANSGNLMSLTTTGALLPLTASVNFFSTQLGIGTPDSSGLQVYTADNDALRLGHRAAGGTFTERCRVDSAGNLLVGTTTATYSVTGRGLVEINGSSDAVLALKRGGSAKAYIQATTDDGLVFVNAAAGYVAFNTNGAEKARIDLSGNLVVTGGGALGYGTGSGGTVTQLTSKSTAVTLNKPSGRITLNNASLAANTAVTFAFNNSLMTVNDVMVLNLAGGNAGYATYRVMVDSISAGTVFVTVVNTTGGALAEALVINFAIIKGSAA
jgi:hypothetical protein